MFSNETSSDRPVLVLNADFRPLSYFPLSLWSWQDAVKAIFMDRVNIISEYNQFVSSPSMKMKLPSVIALKEYVMPRQKPAFTRFNLYLRDAWNCQYCGSKFETHELTFDHLVPKSKGGQTDWQNIVAACHPCNARKSNYFSHECGMHPLRKPRQPTIYELQRNGKYFPPNFLHHTWEDYLYWDSNIES